MDDLVQFLKDRFAEDEQLAVDTESATDEGLHWYEHQREPGDGRWTLIDDFDEDIAEVNCSAAGDKAVARHIARHDPARVLREVEAKRGLLSRYEAMATDVLVMTGVEAIRSEYRRAILPGLALPYAAHSDYQETWKP
ncbi:DUF6221 family protein [Streptomyces sp. NBC_01102]|uniref:DUF6221 family protein n=1 Tax=Streptomyces sp. NBC_01102 TaxID=2903749 RepID=UPI003864B174|nr:DUF6221 family protein [Streptomyces sp. NBC_01102]